MRSSFPGASKQQLVAAAPTSQLVCRCRRSACSAHLTRSSDWRWLRALRRDADPEQVPSAHGSSVPQRWFEDHQPNGGLTPPIYDLLRESPGTLDAAVNALVENYFTDADPAMLLSELGLSGPEIASPLEMS